MTDETADTLRRVAVAGLDRGPVSARLHTPGSPTAGFVFAHGAGAGMEHDFMRSVAEALFQENIAVLRYNFPYMDEGRRAPDRQPVLVRTVRAAVAFAGSVWRGLPLFAGGKSMGGRMTSIAQSVDPLPDVRGLVFLGFPLHPAGQPGVDRAHHLDEVQVPLFFVQGTRDRLSEMSLMRSVIRDRRGTEATLMEIDGADHSLRVPKRSGLSVEQIHADVARCISEWISGVV